MKLNLDEVHDAVLSNKYTVVKTPVKHDFDRCPICNRKYNTEKLPIRVAVNKNDEVKPIVFVDGECRVWGGVKGEEYKFGSIGDSCYHYLSGYLYRVSNKSVYKGCKLIEKEGYSFYSIKKNVEYERLKKFLTKFFVDSKITNKWFKIMGLNKY